MKTYIIRLCSLESYVEFERVLSPSEYALLKGMEHETDLNLDTLAPYILVVEKA
jgi:predicted transcriptional regulator